MKFRLQSKLKPTGDQPQAIKNLTTNLELGVKNQTLLGVTGSGKTFTMANVIEKIQKPALVISHNKTLAAQLYQEFREFFPKNAVHYFVSYYDYYQPEAYIPQTDTYIDKDAQVNEKIDQLRHAATQDLITRKDVIIVASVSCIYNIGSPFEYQNLSLTLKKGQEISRRELIKHLLNLVYQRNDMEPKHGTFSTKGENVEIRPARGDKTIRIEMEGNKIINLYEFDTKSSANVFNSQFSSLDFARDKIFNFQTPVVDGSADTTGQANSNDKNFKDQNNNNRIRSNSFRIHSTIRDSIQVFPAQYWATPKDKLPIAISNIKLELKERLNQLKKQNKILEAQRLEQKTLYDIEIMKETGWCHGIENYSRHLDSRGPGEPPHTLLDYFKFADSNYITFIDESHMTTPQLKAMYNGDRVRKKTLIEYGFRLPSALDNRPLEFGEFEKKINQAVYVSATPGEYELNKSKITNYKLQTNSPPTEDHPQGGKFIIQQLIRPNGLLDPEIKIRPTKGQIAHLIKEIKKRIKNGQRTLITTLTKRLAENLSDFLKDKGIKACYLHSEINTLERPDILRDLRLGKYNVLVGINLLREGLDLPEVSLVAILDADKEGFLRNKTTLIQIMGRAARHPEGCAIMYADNITKSMKEAIEETQRRRKIQEKYNKKYRITPKPIKKEIRPDIIIANSHEYGTNNTNENNANIREISEKFVSIRELEREMKKSAGNLDFEKAAFLRDEIEKLSTGLKKN